MLTRIGLAALVFFAPSIAAQTTTSANPNGQPQQLSTKNPTEYASYMKVVQMPNSIEKAHAADEFLLQYPNSVLKAELLKNEVFVYQLLKNEDEVVRTAERLLECEPTNLRMLVLVTSTYQICATRKAANAKMCSENAVKYGRQGLDVITNVQTPPAGMTTDEYTTLKQQVRPIFESAARSKSGQ